MACFNVQGDAALTEDGRSLALVTGTPRVKQRTEVGLATVRGTYKYNINRGIRWQEALSAEAPVAVETEVRAFLLSMPEIASVRRVTMAVDKSTRTLICSWLAYTADGEEITGTIPVGAR